MDWLQFFASIIGSLAWPVVALAAVILLRRPLTALLPLLRRLKYKDLEVEFDREVRELREEAAAALPPLSRAVASVGEESPLLEMAAVSPRAAVVEAWLAVESAAHRAIERRGARPESDRALAGPQLTRTLMQAQVLDNASRAVFDRLRMLRNQAVHAQDFGVGEASAREYVELALALARRLDAES